MGRPLCIHCCSVPTNRPRGLCWHCYYSPGVREKYPSTSKFARRGVGNFCGNTATAARPTRARPGSPEKVAVLAQRAGLGLTLWHSDDERIDLE